MSFEFYDDQTEDYDSYDDTEDNYDDMDEDLLIDDEESESEESKVIREDNRYINEFNESMIKEGLSEKTIRKHLQNIEFYLYDYLIDYYGNGTMEDGLHEVDSFLGDWFIRKAAWSSVSAIKGNITSLRKFYKCMMENDKITRRQYRDFLDMINEKKESWFRHMRAYDFYI